MKDWILKFLWSINPYHRIKEWWRLRLFREYQRGWIAASKDPNADLIQEELEKAKKEVSRRMIEFASRMAFNIQSHYDISRDRFNHEVVLVVRNEA